VGASGTSHSGGMRSRPLPPALRERPFDVGAADRAGVSRERLRRRDLDRPTRSIRWSSTAPPEGIARIRAFRPVLLQGQFVSHTSAARLWELPVPREHQDDDRVHVTSVRPAAQMRRTSVVGHRADPTRALVRQRWGMPASTPASLWVECGALLGLDDLVVLGDAVVTSSTCRTDIDELRAVLALHGSCRGARRLRAALELIRVGAGSPQETRCRLVIVRAGLPEPQLQVDVHDEQGSFVGRVDMAWPENRVLVEYEGDHHRTDLEQWAADIRRYRELERLGWTVLRWTRTDLTVHRTAALAHLAALLGRPA
jgi:hypothetical protein